VSISSQVAGTPEPWSYDHIEWLTDTGTTVKTADGKTVRVFEFQHEDDAAVLSAWAKHFRNHYCLDADIDVLKAANQSRSDYLSTLKFPSGTSKPGPSIRAGDFGEILVADFLQWRLGYWIPRVRWDAKVIRNESAKGSDVVGFKLSQDREAPQRDILLVCEAKTKFSRGTSSKNRIQDAVNGSVKDEIRIAESVNYIKQRLYERHQMEMVTSVERFQSPVDSPYRLRFAAVGIVSEEHFDDSDIQNTDTTQHPHRAELAVFVIKGSDMMSLVHALYRRAADEA